MKKLVILLIALSLFPAVAQEEGNDSELQKLETYVFPDHGHAFREVFAEPSKYPEGDLFGGGESIW